jgi:hypothetical protein
MQYAMFTITITASFVIIVSATQLNIVLQASFKTAKVGGPQVSSANCKFANFSNLNNLLDFADLPQNFALRYLRTQSFL